MLGFLHVDGIIGAPLAGAVPSPAGWTLTGLPKALDAGQIAAMLASCNLGSATGRRDRAILLLLARMGMRAGEVAALGLDDIDWRRGEITVCGKRARRDRLPLPADVGEAIAGYLSRGRPVAGRREVFLRAVAPAGPLSRGGISFIVRRACRRAGVAEVGAHRLRHTAACEMAAAGAPLTEIGQVLRHQSLDSTANYARVGVAELRKLARPWPGGAA